jgi:hypothetical protein
MREGVSVLRVLAASDVTAGEADAKLVPHHSQRKALLAAFCARSNLLDLAKVFATIGGVRLAVEF